MTDRLELSRSGTSGTMRVHHHQPSKDLSVPTRCSIWAVTRWLFVLAMLAGCAAPTPDRAVDSSPMDSSLDLGASPDQGLRDLGIADAAIDAAPRADVGAELDAMMETDGPPAYDLGSMDMHIEPDERLVDDPLELTNEELFGCEEGEDRIMKSRVWRLNRTQYEGRLNRLIRGDFRRELTVSNPFDGIHSGQQFSEPADAFGMDAPTFDLLMQTAESAADYLTNFNRLWLLPRCVQEHLPEELEACWTETIRTVARSVWERPPTEIEIGRYLEAARGLNGEMARLDTFKFLVRAILISPHAYFRMELGRQEADERGRRRLTGYEVATAIAHSIKDGPPDDLLASVADEGRLETRDDIEREVRRLLGQRDERPAVARFFREFFGHGRARSVFKDPVEFPRLNVSSQVRSVDYTIDHLVSIRGDTVGRLLTSNIIVPDVPLSCPSCADNEGLGSPGAPRQQDPEMRAGVLTHRGWLIANSRNDETDPVARGKFIRERLLCTPVPDVPIGVIPQLPDPMEGQTMRDRLAAHNTPDCQGCHDQMDPLGLSFEMYDHVGLFQIGPDSEIDTTAELVGAGAADGPVDNAVQLAHRLASSTVVRRCFTRTAFRYWLGRSEQVGDACTLSRLQRAVDEADGNFDNLLIALFTSDAFLYRQPPREEAR